jgi:hypothetical protein
LEPVLRDTILGVIYLTTAMAIFYTGWSERKTAWLLRKAGVHPPAIWPTYLLQLVATGIAIVAVGLLIDNVKR